MDGDGLQPGQLGRQAGDGVDVHHVIDGPQVAQVQSVRAQMGLRRLVRVAAGGQVDGVFLRQTQLAAEQSALGDHPVRGGEVLIPQTGPHGKGQGQQALHGAGGEGLRPHVENLEDQPGFRVPGLEAGGIMGQVVGGQLGHHHIRGVLLQLLEHQAGKVPMGQNPGQGQVFLIGPHMDLAAAGDRAAEHLFGGVVKVAGVVHRLVAQGPEIAVDDVEAVVIVVGAAEQHGALCGMHYAFSSVFLSSKASVLSSGVSSTRAVRRISFRSSQTLYCWI